MAIKFASIEGQERVFAALPVVGAALLPKIVCAACWPAYTAALGAIGIEFFDYTPYLVRRKGSSLTLEGFRAAGGVAGAISQTADMTFERRFDEAEKEASKRLFLRLVTPGEGTSDARRILARSEIDRDPGPDVLHRVVEGLTEARLLTVNDETVQIAHEALLRTWPRLRDWIEESRDNLRTRQRISRAAEEWEAEEREPDRLYRGAPLLSALEWVEKNRDQLGVQERAFIDASEAARVREKLQAEEKERRARQVRRIATGALAVLAAGATAASVIAFLAFRDAQRNRELADLATGEANERFALALGAVANKLVADDPLLALYLAAEAVSRAGSGPPGYDARASLLASRFVLSQGGPALLGSPVAMGDARVLALSPDGTMLAAGARSGSIALLDTRRRQPLGPAVQGHKGGVEDLDFGPDGSNLVSVGDDGTVLLWPVDGKVSGDARTLARFHDVVWGVRFDPDGSHVATAAEDGTVRLLDVRAGAPSGAPLVERGGAFFSVAFSPDGHGLVAGNHTGELYGWALPDGTPLFEPIRGVHTSHVWKLAFDRTGGTFATSSSDGKSILFAYPSGRVIGSAVAEGDVVAGVAFAADGSVLIGGGADGGLRLWDVRGNRPLPRTSKGHEAPITDVKASAVRNILVTLAKDQLVRFWRLDSKVPLAAEYRVPGRAAKGVAFSRNGERLAVGDDSGTVSLWTLATRQSAMRLSGHRQQVWALAFSPDGARVISGDRGGEVRVWNAKSGMLERSIDSGSGAIWSISVSPDGTQFLAASESSVRLWDMKTYAPVREILQETGRITRAVWSPDGTRLAVASTDARARIWNISSGIVEREIPVAQDTVWSVAFSPDGKRLATASGDEVVHLWDVASGEETTSFTGHSDGATDVAFSGDGASIVAVDRRGALHFWDVSTGRRLIQPWQAHKGTSWRIAMHPDGQRFVTTGDDGLVKVWDVLSVARACQISYEAFDETRRKEYLGDSPSTMGCVSP